MKDETPEQFRDRIRSLSVIKGGRTKPMEKIVMRPESSDPACGENKTDAGRKAKMTINEERDIILTTSENRQDVNIMGTSARADGGGGES